MMNWEDILKNIQISSQRTGSGDYVLPDEDEEVPDVEQNDEDCNQWWIDLMDMCDELLVKWGGNKFRPIGHEWHHGMKEFSNKELCREKQKIIKSIPKPSKRYSNHPKKTFERSIIRFGDVVVSDKSTFIKFICSDNDLGQGPDLNIVISVSGVYIYAKVVKIEYKPTGNPSPLGNHIGHGDKFSKYLLDCIRIFKDSQNLEKSIQIGSQNTSSRDYVLPDDDDEDCFKWWRGLFAILDMLILAVDKNATLKEHDFGDMTNEYLCQQKENLINEPVKFLIRSTGYIKYSGPSSGINNGLTIGVDDYEPDLFVGLRIKDERKLFYNDRFIIQLEENTKDIKTYKYYSALELVKKFHNAELALMDYLNINGDPRMTAKLIEIYDDYLREKFDVKKNIQISGQRTSSSNYVKPDEDESVWEDNDDEDCREWWRELHRIYNKMINAIDRNATLVIDNEVEKVDNQLLCKLRDSILAMDVEEDTSGIYGRNFKYRKEGIEPYTRSDGTTINVGSGGIGIYGNMLDTKPGPYSGPYATRLNDKIRFSSYYGKYPNWDDLFHQNVSIWNDSILYELNEIKKKAGEGKLYAYNVVEKFLEAELELKKHINDTNPAPFIATKLIAIYETYLNSDVKKSINIGRQKTSSMNYVVDDDERDCREEVLKIADKIMKFAYPDEFNMDNPVRSSKYNKIYVNGFYPEMPPDELEAAERLSLETHFVEQLDEETCCLILETIDKYKGQNLVEVKVKAPMANKIDKELFVYTKDISSQTCFIQIFFPSGKYIATTLSIKLDLDTYIPPDIIIEIEDIFESR